MKFLPATLSTLLVIAVVSEAVHAQATTGSTPLVQVLLGVTALENQNGQLRSAAGEPVRIDFPSLPVVGIETEYLFGRGWMHWGLNPGGSIAWKNDDTTFSASLTNASGGVLQFEADNALFLAELHLGAYARGRFSQRITAYAAAGPMLLYGSHDIKNTRYAPQAPGLAPSAHWTENKTDSSDIRLGYYARAGIDFEINNGQWLGLGVRYLSAELDFNQSVGKIDIKGAQYLLTFTTAW